MRVLAMQEVMNHVIYELIFSASCLDCHLFLFERLGDLLTHWLAPLLPFMMVLAVILLHLLVCTQCLGFESAFICATISFLLGGSISFSQHFLF